MIVIPRLSLHDVRFPAAETALDEPNGLLAYGGDLRPQRLLSAYRNGIFPWFSEDQPILWWSPDPRMVFATESPHVPRRLKRWLKTCVWSITADRSFREVMLRCAEPRDDDGGTWITDGMLDAYCLLHQLGHAHSIEVRDGDELIGGIYGVAIGRMFFGESMFSRRDHASKVALLALCHGLARQDFPLLDAQVSSDHLQTLGAMELPRSEFSGRIASLVSRTDIIGDWNPLFSDIAPNMLGV